MTSSASRRFTRSPGQRLTLSIDHSFADHSTRVHHPGRHRLEVEERAPSAEPFRAMTPYQLNVVRARRRGGVYPYEIARMLQGSTPTGEAPHPDMQRGRFVEYDLDDGRLVPVDRPWGQNSANIVCGVVTSFTERHPEGMRRVILLGDPSRGMGSLIFRAPEPGGKPKDSIEGVKDYLLWSGEEMNFPFEVIEETVGPDSFEFYVNGCPYGYKRPDQAIACDAVMEMDRKLFSLLGSELTILESAPEGAQKCRMLLKWTG